VTCEFCGAEAALWVVGSTFCSRCAVKYEMLSPEEEEFLMSEVSNESKV
jgi:hypothetical protein